MTVDPALLLAFLGVAAVVICTPGPDTALTVRNALAGGRRDGVLTAAGVATGQLTWTVASAVGITGIIVASEAAFLVLRVVGALYLVHLGVRSILDAVRGRAGGLTSPDVRTGAGGRRAFRQGLVNDLANPKMAAFFMSLLPQLAADGSGALVSMLVLGATFSALTFGWLLLFSVAVDAVRSWFARPGVGRVFDGLAGGVLVAFGLRLAVDP